MAFALAGKPHSATRGYGDWHADNAKNLQAVLDESTGGTPVAPNFNSSNISTAFALAGKLRSGTLILNRDKVPGQLLRNRECCDICARRNKFDRTY